ncbi:MAG: hypothetical protein P8N26_11040 [Cyclobacteriaceae bacterium]|nr:hypothetical protein [Cyclobacteriaceae bacterium]
MALISKKKIAYPISALLRSYLKKYRKDIYLPITYQDLLRYNNSIPLYDSKGVDTLWETVFFPQDEMQEIHFALKTIYAIMQSGGDVSVMKHLFVDRIDLCIYGNTKPFRIRMVNKINDNFDYFYIKHADASRVYGLELEDLLAPNRMRFLINAETLIEEHVVGIPGEQFIRTRLEDLDLNKIRLTKEFVKFNERCFVRLLGDMHSSNFVIDITPDFEEISYRLRAIDFDQQSYEGRKSIYLPKYFKENNPIINLGFGLMTPETVQQYQREERSLMANRVKSSQGQINELIATMKMDPIAPIENVKSLGKELAAFYEDGDFLKCSSMGSLIERSLLMLFIKPDLYKER